MAVWSVPTQSYIARARAGGKLHAEGPNPWFRCYNYKAWAAVWRLYV